MKIYISVDMEGLWGVSTKEQVIKGNPEYEHARKLMASEVTLITDILFEQGIETIVVNDAHGSMDNLLIDQLDSRVSLIHGKHKPRSMMQGLNEQFDGIFLIGYHAKANTKGILAHTYASSIFHEIKINDKSYGESGLNALYAGTFNVPVIGISGDDVLAGQIKEEVGDIPFCQVKTAHSLESATHVAKDELENHYRNMLNEAIKSISAFKASVLSTAEDAEITFKSPLQALKGSDLEGCRQVSGNTLQVDINHFETFYQKLLTMINICKKVG